MFKTFFNFFLPAVCSGCKTFLDKDEEVICRNCIEKLSAASEERLTHEFQRKFAEKNIISGFTSAFVFEKDKELQHIIHSLKYEGRFLTGIYLGKLISNSIGEVIKKWKIDFITPIPLHKVKKAERGYNQSFYIAKGLSKSLSIPLNTKIIKRKKFTESQTTMTLKEREENIAGAFKISKEKSIAEKNVLLIDDVITTGATISECGKILLNAGASKIFAASVAIAE